MSLPRFWAARSLQAGPATHGLGYAIAGPIASLAAVRQVRASLKELHYLTFMGQAGGL